jgi:polyisoprenoid-binding protein YceI
VSVGVRFDAASSECLVFTAAEGVLAALAHDLAIRVERFTVAVDAASAAVTASFDPASLRVVGARRAGAIDPSALDAGDRRQIEATIAATVLETARHPDVRFTSSAVVARGATLEVAGILWLHGRERPLALTAHVRPEGVVAEVALHQPDFGITPYRAMLGALKVKPDVLVRLTLRLAGTAPDCAPEGRP